MSLWKLEEMLDWVMAESSKYSDSNKIIMWL